MPYYRWRGVTLSAAIQRGTLFAKDPAHLDSVLLARDIALTRYKPLTHLFKGRAIRQSDLVPVFQQLSDLVSSGILLPEALSIIADQVSHRRLQECMHALTDAVHQGRSLSQSLHDYPRLFSPFAIQLISAGEESGGMAAALAGVSSYYHINGSLRAQLRSTLYLPALTLATFLVMLAVICVAVVPRFADLFANFDKEIPPITQHLISISAFMRSWRVMIPIIGITALLLIGLRLMRTQRGRRAFDWLLLHLPFLGTVTVLRNTAFIFQSLGLLLAGGVHLLGALKIVRKSISNTYVKNQLDGLEKEVRAGVALSDAMIRLPDSIFGLDAVALIRVAHESGELARSCTHLGSFYQVRLERFLRRVLFFVQPVLMITMGLLILLLIVALYSPIISLSSAL